MFDLSRDLPLRRLATEYEPATAMAMTRSGAIEKMM
jgi:hypothetical protein